MKRRWIPVLPALLAAAVLTGCGNRGDESSEMSSVPATERNGVLDDAGDMVSNVADDGREMISDVAEGGREIASDVVEGGREVASGVAEGARDLFDDNETETTTRETAAAADTRPAQTRR